VPDYGIGTEQVGSDVNAKANLVFDERATVRVEMIRTEQSSMHETPCLLQQHENLLSSESSYSSCAFYGNVWLTPVIERALLRSFHVAARYLRQAAARCLNYQPGEALTPHASILT
jgi:hypothetical protein